MVDSIECVFAVFLPVNKFEGPLFLYPAFNIFSSIPNTNTTGVVIAPAENVGQAQILEQPVQIGAGLFGKNEDGCCSSLPTMGSSLQEPTELDDLISCIPNGRYLQLQ